MIAVLARLQWMTLRGRLVRSLRLLRQPKYLVGFIAGFGWIFFWMVRPLLRSHVTWGTMPWPVTEDLTSALHRLVALLATVLIPLPWLLPWGRLGLPFREAELTLLLQAPLTRRQVIQYGLLKSEVGVVLSALVLSLFRGGRGSFGWLPGFLGLWMLFEFWHLNGKWRALFNLRQREIPPARARQRRALLTIGLVGLYVGLVSALLPFLAQAGAALRGAERERVLASLVALDWPPLLAAVLTPAWWLTAPMFARDGARFVAAAAPALLAILAQREVVLRSKARFEESALEQSKTQETKKSPTRRFAQLSSRARSRHPFELDRPGPPEVAVVWKNAMRVSRLPWTRVALGAPLVAIASAVLPAVLRLPDVTYGVLAGLGLFLAILPPLIGGMSWNNDLRTELAHLELIRTWPVPAQRFVLAEVVSPALFSFAGSAFGAGVILSSMFGSRLREALTGEPTQLVLLTREATLLGVDSALAMAILFASFLPLAAAVAFLSSALQNLAILFVPAWMAHGADRSRGVAAFGQRLIFSSGLGLALILALLPSAALVGAALLVQGLLGIPFSAWEFPLWVTLAAAPLFVAGLLAVQLAAGLWQRLDPSQEILEIGR